MSVLFDAATFVSGTSVTSLTTPSFNVSALPWRAAMLGLSQDGSSMTNISGSLGEVAATLIAGTDTGATAWWARSQIWQVLNPPSGSQTATMSWTGGGSQHTLGVVTATGVDPGTPVNNGTFSINDPPNIGIQTSIGDMTVDVVAVAVAGNGVTAPTQTQRWNDSANRAGAGSTHASTASGEVNHGWTTSSSVVQSGANFVSLRHPIVADTIAVGEGVNIDLQLLVLPLDTQGGGGGSEASYLWRPAWLVDLSGIEDLEGYDPEVLRFSHVDIDSLSPPYHGRIVGQPTINRQLADVFWGVRDVAEITVELANADGYLTDLYLRNDLREKPVIIHRYDIASGVIADSVNGRISRPSLEPGKFILRIVSVAQTLAEQLVPSRLISADDDGFELAVDVGVPIPVVFGNARRMLCPYIRDNVEDDIYDYIIGYGNITVETLYRNGPLEELEVVDPEDYIITTGAYPGFTVARFSVRQVDFSNEFHKIYADVQGASRNFVHAVQDVLTNSAWGLSQEEDEDSFDTAAAAMPPMMYCDGALTTQVQVQDLLRELMIVRGMRLGFNASGQWTLTVDQRPTAIFMVAHSGASFNEPVGVHDRGHHIVTSGPRELDDAQNAVSTYIVKYKPNENKVLTGKHTRAVNPFGKERLFETQLIQDSTTADMVCDYLAKREQLRQDTAEFELSQEARRLVEGDLIQLYYSPIGYAGDIVEVQKVSKTLETVRVTVSAWNSNIYFYQAGDTETVP